jgi:hypothetical protein
MGFFQDYQGAIHNKNSDYSGSIATGNTITFRVPVGVTYLESHLRFTVAGTAASRAD